MAILLIMNPKELVYEVAGEEVQLIKNEITFLHERELFERHVYFQQTGKLSGDVVELLKQLNIQEEEHSYLLEIMLKKADLPVKEFKQEELVKIVDYPLDAAIKYDIEQEKISAEGYTKAIDKSSGKIKQLLEHILQEEFEHIGLLEKYLEEV